MRLKITVPVPRPSGAGSEPTNVLVTADATSTVGDVADTLSGSKEYSATTHGRVTLRVADGHRSGSVISPGQTLFDSGLRSGSTVEIVPVADDADAGQVVGATLRIVGGPDAGTEIPLLTGSSKLGRARECDVRLNDPMVSKHHARINVGSKIEIIDTNSANGVLVGGVSVGRVTLGLGDTATLGSTVITVTPTAAVSRLASTSTDIPFVRPPRVVARPRPTILEHPEIPSEPEEQRFPWLAMVAPLLMGAVLFALTR